MNDQPAAIGIIGGSGLYQIEGFASPKEILVETPFGSPSDAIVGGTIHERPIFFLPRHARGPRICPRKLIHRPSTFRLRPLKCRGSLTMASVAAFQCRYPPRDSVFRNHF